MSDAERDRNPHSMSNSRSDWPQLHVRKGLESSLAESGPRRAVIRVATELYDSEAETLRATLENHFGCRLQLQVEVDPSILGGVWVQVGDTVIDGSLRSRLGGLRRRPATDARSRQSQSLPGEQAALRLGESGPIVSVEEGPPGSGRARRRHGVIRVASDPSETEVEELQAALEAYFGSPLRLRVEVDPSILGGVWVQVEGIVIDGSLRGRLGALRDHLHAQCRAMLSAATTPAQSQRGARQTP